MKYRLSILIALFFWGCEDQLNLQPEQSLPTEEALSNLNGLETAVRGAYSAMRSLGYYGRNFYVIPEAASDNIIISLANSGRFLNENRYNLNEAQTQAGLWNTGYNIIARVNNVLENIDNVDENRADEKNNLRVQAFFIRGLVYFDLARTFCQPWSKGNGSQLGVPIVTQTEIGNPPRNTLAEVYDQIINDLTQSINAYDAITNDDNRWSPPFFASKLAAQALLSRVYLYQGDNANAEAAATAVINSNIQLVSRNSYVSYWNSEVLTDAGIGRFIEDIFVLRVLSVESLGAEDLGLIYMVEGFGDLRPTQDILDLLPTNDVRRGLIQNRSGDDYIYKFPGRTNFPGLTSPRILRLSEIVLNRAEARAKSGDVVGATADLNLIRTRAGLPSFNPSASEILAEVLLERRKELAFEGHRSYDIFRNELNLERIECNLPSGINCTVPFTSHLTAFPIPRSELNANPNMAQTEGY
ncbi:MAG: RagB/SusD family nutrient uptake outer membrane protein [Bacteroidota bacterium]